MTRLPEPSPEVARWITVQDAEGKARRTVQERATAQLSTTAVYVAASKARQRTAVETLGRTDGGGDR